jgi:hypothetical protein
MCSVRSVFRLPPRPARERCRRPWPQFLARPKLAPARWLVFPSLLSCSRRRPFLVFDLLSAFHFPFGPSPSLSSRRPVPDSLCHRVLPIFTGVRSARVFLRAPGLRSPSFPACLIRSDRSPEPARTYFSLLDSVVRSAKPRQLLFTVFSFW